MINRLILNQAKIIATKPPKIAEPVLSVADRISGKIKALKIV